MPRSEYLYKALQPTLEDLLMLGRRYETLFDRFEVLLALEYADVSGTRWAPPGRYAWKHRHDGDENHCAGEQHQPGRIPHELAAFAQHRAPLRGGGLYA